MSASSQQKDASLADWVIADPGDAAAIPADTTGTMNLVTGSSGETRTLARPTREGIELTLCMETDGGGDCVITIAGGVDENAADAASTVTWANPGEYAALRSIRVGTATFGWRVMDYDGVSGITITLPSSTWGDDATISFGDSADVLMDFSSADASNSAFVLSLDDTSQQMHITDKGATATDWARSAGTHPEVSIHSNTTPATDYLSIGNHDGTTATVDVVGGTTLNIDIAGTTAVDIAAAHIGVPVDDGFISLGASDDLQILFSDGDASNHAGVIALDNTSQQLHITDVAAKATDWNVSAGTHPSVSIHSNTTPATDYILIGNHDGTTATVDVVGGTTLNVDIAGTSALIVTATAITTAAGTNLGSAAAELGDIFIGDDKSLILGADQDVELLFTASDASNPTTVLAIDDTGQQVHITDKGAVATDWNRSAGTHPELSIHSNTTPATDYLAIGNHDGTTASIDVAGGATLELQIAGSTTAIVYGEGLQDHGNEAVTATTGGGTTGLITAGTKFVTVTSDSAVKQITLPVGTIGDEIWLQMTGTACELIATTAADTVNNVQVGATNELALTSTSTYHCKFVAANTWIVRGFTNLGADEAALVPDAL